MEDSLATPSPPESSISVSSAREEASERPKKARRTFLTQNACTRCRQKKSKCDGRRPVCGRCEKNGAECLYDVAQEGITRMQNLQQMFERKSEDHERLMILFRAFERGSDDVATNLLARLRLGESIGSLVSDVEGSQDSSMRDPSGTPGSQDSKHMQSWPPSPLDQGSWTSWDARCDPSGHTLSQSSESRRGTPRPSTSFKTFDVAQNPHAHLDGEVPGGYYQLPQPGGGFPEQPYFGPGQWQQGYMPNGDANPRSPSAIFSEAGPLEDSKQALNSSWQGRQHSNSRRGGRSTTDPK